MSCKRCFRDCKRHKQGLCNTCYEFLRRNHLIKIKKPVPTPEVLSYIQEQYLIGSMLGDGNLCLNTSAKNARLQISRKREDEGYLRLEAAVFIDFCKNNPVKYKDLFDKRTNKTYYQVFFRTRNCPVLNTYYKNWYPNGKKIVPYDLVLTPEVLLIWFLDDGHCHVSKTGRLKLGISTDGFLKEEVDRLASMLKDLTGFYFSVTKSRSNYAIQCCDGAARAFLKIIDGIYPECMLRKASWRKPEVRFYDKSVKIYKSTGKRHDTK